MTMQINESLLYYCLFAIVFQNFYVYFTFKIWWANFQNNREHVGIHMVLDSLKSTPSYKKLLKRIVNPFTITVFYIMFCVTSPITFPLSLAAIIRKLFVRKKKNQQPINDNKLKLDGNRALVVNEYKRAIYIGEEFPEYSGCVCQVIDDNEYTGSPCYKIRFVGERYWHENMDDEDIEFIEENLPD